MKENDDNFFDREREQEELTSILSARPNLIYFVYGPINSGKTCLLVETLDSLPSEIVPFYINLRGRDVSTTGEFLNVLFDVDEDESAKTERAFISDVISMGLKMLERFSGIPIPNKTFGQLFRDKDKGKDAFKYLEKFFAEMVGGGLKPVFLIDELQMIKEIANAGGRPLLDKLFNFMVRMTKETHLCHCLVATSDSLFVEEIHGSARLEGRSQYFKVDDLNKDLSMQVYDKFDFQDKELAWDYIGGKFGDMVMLQSWLNRGFGFKESLDKMLQGEVWRLRMIEAQIEGSKSTGRKWASELLRSFKEKDIVSFDPNEMMEEAYFWINHNVLFLDIPIGLLRPQGRLMQKAIGELN
jgi:uncharacterized protein